MAFSTRGTIALVGLCGTGILILPSFILTVCGLFMARRRRDPARIGFTYWKLAFGFFTIFLFLDTIAAVFVFLLDYGYSNSAFAQANNHTFYLGRWAETISHILLSISLYEIGAGILYAVDVANSTITPGSKTFLRGIGRYAFLALAGILFVLSIAVFGLSEALVNARFRGGVTALGIANISLQTRRVHGAVQILLFVVSVGLLALGGIAVHKSKKNRTYSHAAVLLLVCTIFWLVRCVWVVAYTGRFLNLPNLPVVTPAPPPAVDMADVFVNAYPVFIALCIIFGLGVKKQPNGLWSQSNTQNYQGSVPPQTNSQYIPPSQGYPYGGGSPEIQSTQQPIIYQYQQPMQQQQQMYQQPVYQPSYQQPVYQPPSVSSTSPPPSSVQQYQQPYYSTPPPQELAPNGRYGQAYSPPPQEMMATQKH